MLWLWCLVALLQADTRCVKCHASIAGSFAATGMGRSITPVSGDAVRPRVWRHKASGATLTAGSDHTHAVEKNGVRAAYRMEFAIGSGHQGRSYAWRLGDALFQSPIAWYRDRGLWDASPGYENDLQPDFYRPITAECLFCHAGAARPVPGSQNRYLDPPFAPAAIGCARCHGDGDAHSTTPAAGNIVNPAKLSRERRDSVCEACHLSGEVRIPNPGMEFHDFRPGMQLEQVFSVYVAAAGSNSPQQLKVVSHVEQLALSRCSLASNGRMWCVSCHDPHREPPPSERAAFYRDKCLSCHAGAAATAHRTRQGDDCVQCHMPRKAAYDGGHTAFTDHWIRRDQASTPVTAGVQLRAWREPRTEWRKRNLALAYIGSAEKEQSLERLQRGVRLLNEVMAAGGVDAAVAQAAGLQLLQQNKALDAVKWFRKAVDEQPANSLCRSNLAAALFAAGDQSAARKQALEAIRLEPLLEQPYALLAEIDPASASHWKAQYRKLAPKRILP